MTRRQSKNCPEPPSDLALRFVGTAAAALGGVILAIWSWSTGEMVAPSVAIALGLGLAAVYFWGSERIVRPLLWPIRVVWWVLSWIAVALNVLLGLAS